MINTTVETKLLLLIIGNSQLSIREIQSIVETPDFSWETFITLVRRNGIHGFVFTQLLERQMAIVPQKIFEGQKKLHQGSLFKAMRMSYELQRVMDFFVFSGIDAITFKGPTLAKRYYGDINSRDYCDLDILISPEKVKVTIERLSTIGYEYQESDFSAADFDTHIRLRQECTLVHKEKGIPIDLHWGFHKTTIRYIDDITPLFERAKSIEIALGKEVKTLSGIDLLFIESIHLFDDFSKKQFSLKLATDFLKIAESLSTVEWKLVVTMHKEQKQLGKLVCWCALCTTLFDFDPPEIVKDRMKRKKKQVQLGKRIAAEFFSPKPFSIGYLLSLSTLFDSAIDAGKFLLHLLLFSITDEGKFQSNFLIKIAFKILRPIRALTVKLVK